MADYIPREAAIDAIEGINWYKYNDEGRLVQGGTSHDKMFLPYKAVEGSLKAIPAADVRPVVRGRWRFEEGDGETCAEGWVCSACGCGFHTHVPYFEDFNFCPNCGADMMEES